MKALCNQWFQGFVTVTTDIYIYSNSKWGYTRSHVRMLKYTSILSMYGTIHVFLLCLRVHRYRHTFHCWTCWRYRPTVCPSGPDDWQLYFGAIPSLRFQAPRTSTGQGYCSRLWSPWQPEQTQEKHHGDKQWGLLHCIYKTVYSKLYKQQKLGCIKSYDSP